MGCPGRGGRGMLSACPSPKAIAFSLLSPEKKHDRWCWELTGFHHAYWCREPCQGTPKGREKSTGRGTGHKGIACDPPNPTTVPGIGVFRHRQPGRITTPPPPSRPEQPARFSQGRAAPSLRRLRIKASPVHYPGAPESAPAAAATKGTRAPASPASASITSSGCLVLIRFPSFSRPGVWGPSCRGGCPSSSWMQAEPAAVVGRRRWKSAEIRMEGPPDSGNPAPPASPSAGIILHTACPRLKTGGYRGGNTSFFPALDTPEDTQSIAILAGQAPCGTCRPCGVSGEPPVPVDRWSPTTRHGDMQSVAQSWHRALMPGQQLSTVLAATEPNLPACQTHADPLNTAAQ